MRDCTSQKLDPFFSQAALKTSCVSWSLDQRPNHGTTWSRLWRQKLIPASCFFVEWPISGTQRNWWYRWYRYKQINFMVSSIMPTHMLEIPSPPSPCPFLSVQGRLNAKPKSGLKCLVSFCWAVKTHKIHLEIHLQVWARQWSQRLKEHSAWWIAKGVQREALPQFIHSGVTYVFCRVLNASLPLAFSQAYCWRQRDSSFYQACLCFTNI